jgi:hypothetical protein
MIKNSYLLLFWNCVYKDTIAYYQKDKRAWIYNIAAAFLIAIISTIVSYQIGVIVSTQYWQHILEGIISGGLFLIIWFVGVFVWNLLTAPNKLYDRLKFETTQKYDDLVIKTSQQVEDYRIRADKWTWNDVSIVIPEISIKERLSTVLLVINNKPYDIEKCIVKIVSIKTIPSPIMQKKQAI